ncbi:MAG: FtsX-like permease family protein [Candidatus Thorarchaeota archaeon]
MTSPLVHGGLVGVSGVLLIPLLSILISSQLSVLASLLFAATVIVLLAVFIVGLTLLLSRMAASLKSTILTRIQNQRYVVGLQLIGRSARVFRRTESYSLMFIAMVFTAGISSSLAATTGNNHMKALFQYEVGADIVVNVIPGLENVTSDLVNEIEEIDGVMTSSGILEVGATAEFWNDWGGNLWRFRRRATIFGVDGTDFVGSAFFMPYFTHYQSPVSSFQQIDDNHSKVIASFMPIIGYETTLLGERVAVFSDEVVLEVYSTNGVHRSNYTIADVMADYPGGFSPQGWWFGRTPIYSTVYFPGESSVDLFVVVNLDHLHTVLSSKRLSKIYVDLEPGADYSQVMDEIAALAPNSFTSIDSPLPSIDEILDTRAGQTIYGAYSLNIMFSVLYLTVGTSLVMTAKIRKMRKSFSILRALGSEPETITNAMLVDTTTGLILGAVIGAISGYMLTLIVLSLPLTYLGLSTAVSWEGLPVTMAFRLELIVGIVIVCFIFSLAATYVVMRRGLSVDIAQDLSASE